MEASALSAPAGLNRRSVSSPLLRLRSDEQLVALFRSGHEEAFGVIHDRYRQRLFAYSRQMLGGSRSDAEDVLQDVFLRAYRTLRADDRPLSLKAWLYRVAHNRCIDQLRRPVPAPADVLCVSRTPLQDPLLEAERREELARLVADVRRLPSQQRSALLMREMEGMSYADLAAALDSSIPAIKSLLVRARIGLVEAIEARDADCADIRHDLAASYDRGVRTSSRARRHLRDCGSCTTYRAQLREVRRGFAALSPSPAPATALAKLLGLGGASSGAAAGGAAAGSGGALVGGGAAAVSVTKVAALVCCAAVLGGGAVQEVQQAASPPKRSHARAHHAAVTSTGPVAVRQAQDAAAHVVGGATVPAPTPKRAPHAAVSGTSAAPLAAFSVPGSSAAGPTDPSGGQIAPDDTPPPAAPTTSQPTPQQQSTDPLSALLGTTPASGSQPPASTTSTGSSATQGSTSSGSGATAQSSTTPGSTSSPAGPSSGSASGSSGTSSSSGTGSPSGSTSASGSTSSSGSSTTSSGTASGTSTPRQ